MSDLDGLDAFNNVMDRLESYAGRSLEERNKMYEAQSALREAERERDSLRQRNASLRVELDVANQRIAELTPPPQTPVPWTPPASPGALDVVKAALEPPDDMPF